MKKFFISLISFFVFTLNSQAQWNYTLIPLTTGPVWSADAIGDNFAILSTSKDKILITTDCGKTWINKIFPASTAFDISLVNDKIFYAAGEYQSFYKTTDGGDTWTTIFSNPDLHGCCNYIEMFNETKGIAMADGPSSFRTQPLILRTANGANWVQTCSQPIGFSGDIWRRIDFVNENVGYFFESGNNPQKLLKTVDGGSTWSTLNYPYSYIQVLKFYDESYGLTYMNGTFHKTTDGGASWQVSGTIDPPGWGVDIEFLPGHRDNIWFSNLDNIFYSSDGGATWLKQTAITGYYFREIVFTNDKVGWVFMDNGNVYYTNNNGGLATSIESNEILPNAFRLSQNYPNPFNPSTVINYQLPIGIHAILKIYDLLGREVTTLLNEFKQAGTYNLSFRASDYNLPGGIYFYRLTAGAFSSTQKMVLIK